MTEIFDQKIFCKDCGKEMKKAKLVRNNFEMRALMCEKCGSRIIHPADEKDYKDFLILKNKEFRVKLRLVGNSYAVSIPKEIISFMREQEKMFDDMVRLVFDDTKRLRLMFE